MMRGFYFITDGDLSLRGNEADVALAARSGCALIQYRAKRKGGRELFEEAARLKALSAGVPFIVNDRLDIALAVGAAGVHLGQGDVPLKDARRLLGTDAIIGVSVSSAQEALEAERSGANYLGVGPIFPTGTKTDASLAIGLEGLARIRKATSLPLAAIGGIDLCRAASCARLGADMVCAISATVAQAEPEKTIREFQGIFI
jgi:thiamine-phosphate pyrophosphorylase